MVRVHALRVAENLWRRSLTISRKLSGPTWVTLAVINATIAVLSFWAYFAKSVSDSAIPPIYYVENNLVPLRSPQVDTIQRMTWASSTGETPGAKIWLIPVLSQNRDFFNSTVSTQYATTVTGKFTLSGTVYGSNFQPALNVLAIEGFDSSNRQLARLVASTRLVLQAPSNAPSLLTPVQQIVAIGVGIFTSFLSAISTFFAWQTYRRAKAQEILVQLQIAKLHAELAEYDEKARRKQAESGIILAT